MLSRRGFIGFLAAPAIVRATSLMPVKAFLEEGHLLEKLTVQWAPGYPVMNPEFKVWMERALAKALDQTEDWLVAKLMNEGTVPEGSDLAKMLF